MSEPASSPLHAQLAKHFRAAPRSRCASAPREALARLRLTRACWCTPARCWRSSRTTAPTPSRPTRRSRCGCRCRMPRTASCGSSPGTRPRLILHQPPDYWYQSRADCRRPTGCAHFDIRPCARPRRGARAPAARPVRHRLHRRCASRSSPPGASARSIPPPSCGGWIMSAPPRPPTSSLCLREASRLGALGHLAAARAFRAGASEFEIELAFLKACGLREQELPYNPIIALNAGGAVLHYQVLEKQPPPERHSLLIDAGAEFAGYASDITRTYSRRGCRLRRADRAHGPHAAGAVRAGARRGRLARRPPVGAPR